MGGREGGREGKKEREAEREGGRGGGRERGNEWMMRRICIVFVFVSKYNFQFDPSIILCLIIHY